MLIGIDLGTTFSAAARLSENGTAVIIPNREGDRLTPSVVAFQGGKTLVGKAAVEYGLDKPLNTIACIKRRMGDAKFEFLTDDDDPVVYKPEQISAAILKRIAADCEAYTVEKVTGVVITVPAYFNDRRRMATRQAGEIAGLNVLSMINEPTAAALAYGVMQQDRTETVMVFDLGGGTFDVTIEHITPGEIRVIASGGDCDLGGVLFDNALLRYAHDAFEQQYHFRVEDDEEAEQALRMNCEALKRRLSTQDAGDLMIRARGRGMMLHITRQMFEEMIEGIVHRAMIRVDRVLSDANMTAAQLDRILLVGGSTRIPYIREQLAAHLRHEICADIVNPDEAVALGAAYYAQMLVSGNALAEASAMQRETQAAPETPEEPAAPTPVMEEREEREERPADDRRLGLDGGKEPELRWGMQGNVVCEEVVIPDFTDVTAHGYGVKAYDFSTGQYENYIMIPRNTPLPVSRTQVFCTTENGQTSINVEVTEGNETDLKYVTIIGTMEASFERSYPRDVPIQVTLSVNTEGVLEVSAFDPGRGIHLNDARIERRSSLRESEVEEMKQQMSGSILL